MNVDELNLPEAARRYIRGYASDTLYPPQEQAVRAGLLEGASLMVSAPTASGKTLVAMMAVVAMLERGGRRAAYLSPLRRWPPRSTPSSGSSRGSPWRTGAGLRLDGRPEQPRPPLGKPAEHDQREDGPGPAEGRGVAGRGGPGDSRRGAPDRGPRPRTHPWRWSLPGSGGTAGSLWDSRPP